MRPRVARGTVRLSLGAPGGWPGTPFGQALNDPQAAGGMLGFSRKKFVGSYWAFRALKRRKPSGW